MIQLFKNKKIEIKPTKLFSRNRIHLIYKGRNLNVFEHKVLDFLLLLVLDGGVLQLQFSPNAFFEMANFKKPNGAQYKEFYATLGVLYDTSIFWLENKCSNFNHILDKVSFVSDGKRINNIVVFVNPEINNVLLWTKSNIIQNLRVTMALRRKYSYFLYLFLLENYIQNGEVHTYTRMKLRNRLLVNPEEKDKHFKIYLRAAIKEINFVANWNLKIEINRNTYYIQYVNKENSNSDVADDENISDNSNYGLEDYMDDLGDECELDYKKVYKKYQKMHDVLKEFPEIGEIMDEQTSKRRGEL